MILNLFCWSDDGHGVIQNGQWDLMSCNGIEILTLLPLGDVASHLEFVIFKLISRIYILGISYKNAPMWMPGHLTDYSHHCHYLSQWWPRSMSPYGITRPQWVNMVSGWLECANCDLLRCVVCISRSLWFALVDHVFLSVVQSLAGNIYQINLTTVSLFILFIQLIEALK